MTELEALTARVAREDQKLASLAHELLMLVTFGPTYDPIPAEDRDGIEPEPEVDDFEPDVYIEPDDVCWCGCSTL